MADDHPENQPADGPQAPSVDNVLSSVRRKLGSRDSRGRPVSVYGVLGIGVATLLVLLLVVYFSAADRDNPDQPICTTIQPDQAELAVRDGNAQRLTIAYDDEVEMPANDRWGPVLARLDYADGQCANLPQGIANQGDVYAIVGVIYFYTETTENPQVEIVYDRSNSLDEGLFVPPTIPTTPTPVPTATPVPSPTLTVTEEPATTDPPIIPAATPSRASPAPRTLPPFGTPAAGIRDPIAAWVRWSIGYEVRI